MEVRSFSKGEALAFGWATMKANLGFFIGLMIVVGLINFLPDAVGKISMENLPFLNAIRRIAFEILNFIVGMGCVKIAIKLCDNEKGEFGDLFSCFHLFFKYLFGSILYGLIVFGGMLLFIIPGIIWAIKFQYFSYFIIDKEVGPIEALKKSAAITAGVKADLFVFWLLMTGINILGILCLFVGLFATIPTTMVAAAFVYRKLLAQTEEIIHEPESSWRERVGG